MTTMVFSFVLIGGGAYAMIAFKGPLLMTNKEIAKQNDSVMVGSVDRYWFKSLVVQQCPGELDTYFDVFIIFLLNNTSTENIIHRKTVTINSSLIYQSDPSYKTGIVDYQYMLANSSFVYELCTSSPREETSNGIIYIFNDLYQYWYYIDDQEHGTHYSIFQKNISIGVGNSTVCTKLTYTIPASSYYYIVTNTPGDIHYHLNFTADVLTYELTGLTKSCSLSQTKNSCNLGLPGNDLEHRIFDVLAYIQPHVYISPITTSICLDITSYSKALKTINVASWGAIGLGLVLLVMLAAFPLLYLLHKLRPKKKIVAFLETEPLLSDKEIS